MEIRKHIPNTITCLNLISGAISIIFAFQGNFEYAFCMILIAAVFDFFDGLVARLLKTSSEIGKELDSLSDVVSFGLAPSLILYNFMAGLETVPCPYIKYIPLLIAAFSALRLAKFNLDTRQSYSFIGLPTPASAIFLASLVSASVHSDFIRETLSYIWVIPVLSLIISYLLISEIDFMSMKFTSMKWADNVSRYLFFISAAVLAILFFLTGIRWDGIVSLVFLIYLLWNLVDNTIPLFSMLKKKEPTDGLS